ncbi:unnamed protein product, partial [Onchocerca ochengi]|uniref:Piwi domain-containing protein n=1 Tax=Onchocerca ochengi TaxID=42157 RepID=A0A182EVD4_ONCOC
MTSFGAEIAKMEFMPIFKVKGQIYHEAGSPLPLPDMRLLKSSIDEMQSDTHKIVIHVEKTPDEEHVRRFNAPTKDKAAIVIVVPISTQRCCFSLEKRSIAKIVDTHRYMYSKIEIKRLIFIRLNQTKLRSEECIHLRDAVVNDGNKTCTGRLTILPSLYADSARHLHEYNQCNC